ncbi:UDP-3-O-(3-hydroxymyristoyl)glucosamine N-acyltransferase [Limisphaera ngatamarikiensis]|uniref:UDP-3-O-acylglucosamine N-acyltransferase n=1 Tax=Limisphaera ngatamarikiensis TaxID=1324935 RepID=A0A6M1RLN8_9BACT|nr:UDP-3-O-(3-hydroxymyristoyl)glucosamine N-acyltransferase [Limisphaera ngatamarikiensis]NGO38387.1 UDP-3-O-(3-hydroxymyristoyl)glucosamine N-acyltransferase [Limisphaera ngatamarikiensis]
MPFTAAEIARHLGGEVIGDGSVLLHRFAPADRAEPGDLTFAENEVFLARAEQGRASAILVDRPVQSAKTLIRVPNARIAFARVLPLFFPEVRPEPGIHPTAVVGEGARVDPTAHVGPWCVIGARAVVGPRSVLWAQVYVGEDCELAEDVWLFPQVVLYPRTKLGARVRIHSGTVIGSDGFGYVQDGPVHLKVPQVGSVIIEEDVEIGANVAVDRGALGATVIGRGTKIDNLVQIAHNVTVGERCLIVAQTGIAGSTRLGNYVVLAGQVGLAGHLKIGHRVSVAAKSGVMHDIPDGQKWLGIPAQPDRQAKRQIIALQQLPDLLRRVSELEKQVAALQAALAGTNAAPPTSPPGPPGAPASGT